MFQIRVEVAERKMSELVATEDNDYMEVFKEPMDRECVEFSMGNPRVEHITGLVHLYKRNAAPYGSHEPWKAAKPQQELEASRTLCCLAIPADMSVAHFCTFIGAYLGQVRSIQVLRREGSQPSVCMVLLTFADQEQADSFYGDFNGMPFSSLEPDIPCRLVYVRELEVLSSQGRPSPVSLPAAAKAITATTAAAAASAGADTAPAGPAKAESPPSDTAAAANDTAPAQASSSAAGVSSRSSAAGLSAGSSKQSQHHSDSSKASSSAGERSQQAAQQQPQQPPQAPAAPSYAAAVGGQAVSSVADGAAAAATTAAGAAAKAGAAGSGEGGPTAQQRWLDPPAGTTELPTCPVCLERLDEHISGIVTTVCNHRFHGECIKHWGDTSCPVCRYCMLSSNASTSRCSTCGTNTNLWICLICGHVGCGRYKAGHANDHWKSSAHCYALELETQRVWDYAGDGYVHRLIQSKTDGKLVEVPSPAPTCPHGSPSLHHHRHHHHHHHHRQRSTGDQPGGLCRSRSGSSAAVAGACSSGTEAELDASSDCPVCADEHKQMKEALVSSKLEAISLEYNHLLATQLDSQRQYFEGLLAQQEAKQQAAVAAARAAAEQAATASEAAAASARDSERKRQQLERKLSELNASLSKATEEREFLRSLNDTLLSNQKDFNTQLAAAQAELSAKEAQLQDLQEQVRDLMVFIEAQRTIQSAGGSELQDATLLPVPQSRTSSARSSRRTSKK